MVELTLSPPSLRPFYRRCLLALTFKKITGSRSVLSPTDSASHLRVNGDPFIQPLFYWSQLQQRHRHFLMPFECSGGGEVCCAPHLVPQKRAPAAPKIWIFILLRNLCSCVVTGKWGVITGSLCCFYRWKISEGCLWYMSLVWPPGYAFSPELSAF